MIECRIQRCKERYIAETEIFLHDQICEHIGDIKTKMLEKPVAKHFNLTRNPLSDMTATIMKKVNDKQYRRERARYLIQKFNSFYGGLNLKP